MATLRKLPYFDFWDNVPAKIILTDGLDEDGEPKKVAKWQGLVNFSEKAKRIQNKDGLWIKLSAVIHVKGDILPGVVFRGGYVKLDDYDDYFQIVSYSRPRNPDGTVNHTKLELI